MHAHTNEPVYHHFQPCLHARPFLSLSLSLALACVSISLPPIVELGIKKFTHPIKSTTFNRLRAGASERKWKIHRYVRLLDVRY